MHDEHLFDPRVAPFESSEVSKVRALDGAQQDGGLGGLKSVGAKKTTGIVSNVLDGVSIRPFFSEKWMEMKKYVKLKAQMEKNEAGVNRARSPESLHAGGDDLYRRLK